MIGWLVREKGFFEYLDEHDYFRRTDEEYRRLIETMLRPNQICVVALRPDLTIPSEQGG